MLRTATALFVATSTILFSQAASASANDRPIDFDRHVHALLDRLGCNAGKCHGNRDGKGGFSLSLFAANAAKDHAEILCKGQGRYVNVADPERSLLLLKATGQLKHEGGIRVTPSSWEYRVQREWISNGARRISDAPITALTVVPEEHVFKMGDNVPLKVLAQ